MKHKSTPLTIEIRGVGFVNKGAELMLQAIRQKMNEYDSTIRLVMEVNYGQKKSEELSSQIRGRGLFVKPSGRKWKINIPYLFSLIPRKIRQRKGIVLEQEIDVVIDSSGFAFGDQWGVTFMRRRLTNKIQEWKEKGKKVILLPQAFGPFSDDGVKKEMMKVYKFADIIFVRDKVSYDNVITLTGRDEKIQLYPDFTNLLVCRVPQDFDSSMHHVAIIPNFKMGKVEGGIEQYKRLLKRTIGIIVAKGLNPFFLIHEGKKDEDIANDINSKLDVVIPVIKGKSAEDIKGIIGGVQAVITSRFHGLVSALSQGTPCLATSWSHKYKMLLADYECPESLIDDLAIGEEELVNKLDLILDSDSRTLMKNKLLVMANKQKQLSKEMWSKVFSLLSA